MSTLRIYVLFDHGVNSFLTPFFVRSQREAEDVVRRMVNSAESESIIAQHPADFDLWSFGSFFQNDGHFEVEFNEHKKINNASFYLSVRKDKVGNQLESPIVNEDIVLESSRELE